MCFQRSRKYSLHSRLITLWHIDDKSEAELFLSNHSWGTFFIFHKTVKSKEETSQSTALVAILTKVTVIGRGIKIERVSGG